ncbi:MAG: ABC transporter ATP-binding protein [Polyangiaceae bacterium]|nr:ABC transporter ATP-binding protein [Polyangiaceae bacterium]
MEWVRLEGVSKRFGATVALRGISLELSAGTPHLIVGANGSGKSTLLGVLAGNIRPTSGSVRVGPGDHLLRAEVGLLSHETLAYADLTGRQNVELAAEMFGIDPALAWADAVERFDLGTFAERPLRTNSRGQKQRIALARAMVHRPSVVLLDEPTTGLDDRGVERLLTVAQEEVERGSLLVIVAHDVETWKSLGAKTIRLDRGRVESFT